MNAEEIEIGTGHWSCDRGTVYSDSTDPKAVITHLKRSNPTQCTWFVSNGVCQSNLGFINVFRANPETPPTIYFNDEKVVDETIHICEGDEINIKGNSPDLLYERGQWVSFGPSLNGIMGTDSVLNNIEVVGLGVQQVGWFIYDRVSGCAPNRLTFSIEVHEKPDVDANTNGGQIITRGHTLPRYYSVIWKSCWKYSLLEHYIISCKNSR